MRVARHVPYGKNSAQIPSIKTWTALRLPRWVGAQKICYSGLIQPIKMSVFGENIKHLISALMKLSAAICADVIKKD